MFFDWNGWLRTSYRRAFRTVKKTAKKRIARPFDLRLEPLEDRTAPATLPAPIITNPDILPITYPNDGTPATDPMQNAQIAMDPLNPAHMVAAASYNPVAPSD